MNAPDVHIQIQALRDRFAERVRLELVELDDLLAKPMVGAAGLQRATSVLQVLHNIAGDARSLGLYRLRQESRVLEEALRPVVEANENATNPSITLGSTFAEHVRELRDLLESDLNSRVPNTVIEAYHTPKELYRRPQPEDLELLEPDVEALGANVEDHAEDAEESAGPDRIDPEMSDNASFESDAIESDDFEPEHLESDASEPDTFEPDASEPNSFDPDEFESEAFGPEALEPESSEHEPVEQEPPEQELSEQELSEQDVSQQEPADPESYTLEPLESERFEPETFESESLKADKHEPENFELDGFELDSFEPDNFEGDSFAIDDFDADNFEIEDFEAEDFETESFDAESDELEHNAPDIAEPETLELKALEPEAPIEPDMPSKSKAKPEAEPGPEPKVEQALEQPAPQMPASAAPEAADDDSPDDERLDSVPDYALDYELLAPGSMTPVTSAAEAPDAESREAGAPGEPEPQPAIPLVEPSWVVLLEPNAKSARQLARGLQQNGYEVHWLTDMDGLEAFARQAGAETSVTVVADTGFAQALADAPFMRSSAFLPVIYLSNTDSFDLRYRLAKSQAGGFFVRPVELPMLAERIERQMAETDQIQRGRVLVVGDDIDAVGRYQTLLRESGLEAMAITKPEECFVRLAEFRPDVMLMDTQAGRYSSEILTRTIRLQPEWQDVPVIHLRSRSADDARTVESMGDLDDVMSRSVSDRQLVRSVQMRCSRTQRVKRFMSRDSLTGVLNHRLIKQALADEVARIRRNRRNAVVALVDVDDLASVNANYGHPQGDRVIRRLANVLDQRLRCTDRIGRYSGEEFVVVLPDCDELDAWTVLDDICRHFARQEFKCDAGSFRVTLSVGLVQLGEFSSAETALLSADRALHSRKEAGMDGVAVFS